MIRASPLTFLTCLLLAIPGYAHADSLKRCDPPIRHPPEGTVLVFLVGTKGSGCGATPGDMGVGAGPIK